MMGSGEGELNKRAIRMEEIDDLVVKMLDVEEAKADLMKNSHREWLSPTKKVNGEVQWADEGTPIEYICLEKERFVRWFGSPH